MSAVYDRDYGGSGTHQQTPEGLDMTAFLLR